MLLDPKGFAVIGASTEPGKVGHEVFKNLLKSKVKTYPINPNASRVLGRKCYPLTSDLKGKVSHAVIAVPAKIVPIVLRDCVKANVKYAVIISAGFKEAGNTRLEEEVKKIAIQGGIRILGPNVLGIIKPGSYNASFYTADLKPGNVSFISQSGALGVAVLDSFTEKNWGLRSFISIGNASDLTITDTLKELIKDKSTKSIIIYAESLIKGQEFIKTCQKSKKPIFILKAGKSEAGMKAVSSHTGALAGSDEIYNGVFKQSGIIRVNSLSALIKAGLLSSKYGLLKGEPTIITNAGGPGVLLTDYLTNKGVKLAKLNKSTIKKLDKSLTGVAWSHNNPIDLVGDAQAERYAKALKVKSDYLIVILTPQAMSEPLKTAKLISELKKPVLPCFMGGAQVKNSIKHLEDKGFIVFQDLTELANVIKALTELL